MTTAADAEGRGAAADRRSGSFVSFLADELRSRPGRVAMVVQIALGCALVTAVDMVFQIPLAGTSVYIVLLTTRPDRSGTLQTAIVSGVAATLAIALSLLFYMLDASEPALRIPLMAISAFIGMYCARTMVIGPAAFLVGYVLVLGQTLIDLVPSVELLTRLVLWLWVVVMLPAAVTVLVNLALGNDARALARKKAVRLLSRLADTLRTGETTELHEERDEAVELLELRQRAALVDKDLKGLSALDARLIEDVAEVVVLQRLLVTETPRNVRLHFAAAVDQCARELADDPDEGALRPEVTDAEADLEEADLADPVVLAISRVLDRIRSGLTVRRTGHDPVPAAHPARTVFLPGAFEDPSHARFAFKATLAAMAAYVIYSGLAWPGMSTSVTTAFFVSLGSLGESMHKLTLRIGGALFGALLAMVALVFVLPHVTDIGGLCIVVAVGAAIGGWVSTSDQRLAYAGMQIALAFFLGVLQGYGEGVNFTVLKDRIFGILLGNVLVTVVFSSLWPVSVTQQARASVAAALRTLADLLRTRPGERPGARVKVVRALSEERRLLSLARFELRMVPAADDPGGLSGEERVERLAAATLTLAEQRTEGDPEAAEHEQDDEALAAWLSASAVRLLAGEGFAPPPTTSAGEAGTRRGAVLARALLQHEMEVAHASST